MILKRWDYKERKYKDHEVPDDWHVTTDEFNMTKIINCASCGKKIKYNSSNESREIHSDIGMGYAVCLECHKEEWVRYALATEKNGR